MEKTSEQRTEDALHSILAEFQKQGEKRVYVTECCGRLYVGVQIPTGCRTCSKTPDYEEVILG